MSYLDIIERLKNSPGIAPGNQAAHGPGNEINEINEISPTTPERTSPAAGDVTRCGSPNCAGCYSIGEIDGRERFMHPPKSSPEWLAWRAKCDLAEWQPPKGSRKQ